MKRLGFKIIGVSILFLICMILSFLVYHYTKYAKVYIDKDISKINLDKINKVMIVAHPDDELLWGASHLMEDNYLVVCITCGSNRNRVLEFQHAMQKTKDAYIMLAYPDKTNKKRDTWDTHRKKIKEDLKEILGKKDWNFVVTHNPEGEYGHIHHQMTSQITTELLKSYQEETKLLYFGKYYSKNNVSPYETKITEESQKIKEKLMVVYPSQKKTLDNFSHMFAYENWLSYQEWMVKYEK